MDYRYRIHYRWGLFCFLDIYKMKNLIFIGAGDWSLEIWSWLEEAKGYGTEFIFKGFLDENSNALAKFDFCRYNVLGNINEYVIKRNDVFVCTIANPEVKEKVTKIIIDKGGKFLNLVHKNVILFNNITFGKGIIISPNCVISNNCILGDNVAVNLSSTLGHDVNVGNYCQINSQCDLTGYVTLGEKVFLGSRVTLIPKVKVTDNVVIGAGSVVFRNINNSGTYIGNPAKKLI